MHNKYWKTSYNFHKQLLCRRNHHSLFFSDVFVRFLIVFCMHFIHSAWFIRYEGDNYFFLPHLPPTSIIPLYFYLPFSRVTFHCLSFVPLTVIHLPGRFHWISWSVMKISWLLFIHSGRIYPEEKLLLLYKFVRGKVFRCGTPRPVIPWHRHSLNQPILWTDYGYIWHDTYHSHLKISFKISKSSVISGFRRDVNENYQSTARKIPRERSFRNSLFIFWWLIAATDRQTQTRAHHTSIPFRDFYYIFHGTS